MVHNQDRDIEQLILELNNAYLDMPETYKKVFCSQIMRLNQKKFDRFKAHSPLKGRKQFISTRPKVYAKAIDKAIIDDLSIFEDLINFFFQDTKEGKEINDFFIQKIDTYTGTNKVVEKTEDLLIEIQERFDTKLPGLVRLYDAGLRLFYEEKYFVNIENEYSSNLKNSENATDYNTDRLTEKEAIEKKKLEIFPCSLNNLEKLRNSSDKLNEAINIYIAQIEQNMNLNDIPSFHEKVDSAIDKMELLYKAFIQNYTSMCRRRSRLS